MLPFRYKIRLDVATVMVQSIIMVHYRVEHAIMKFHLNACRDRSCAHPLPRLQVFGSGWAQDPSLQNFLLCIVSGSVHYRYGKALEITDVRMNDEEKAVVTLRL